MYPRSSYIFEETDDSTVSQFLTTGRSIYRLNRGEKIDTVFEYYVEALTESKWAFVQSVPRTSHEMMYGDYYFNEELGYGVRIYDRVNDIWYEKLTKNEAETGMADYVSKKYERDLILSSDEGTSLLPDFPWDLTVPREYLVKYFPTDEEDLRGVTFTEIATGKETILEPITELTGEADDVYAEVYIDTLNIRAAGGSESEVTADETQDQSLRSWQLINTAYVEINGVHLLEATVSYKTKTSRMYILHNTKVNYAYGVNVVDDDTSFLSFLLLNMTERKADYTGDEFRLE